MSTPVTAANFAISNWGAGASIGTVVGTDRRCTVTVLAGTGGLLGPSLTITWPAGPFPIPPLSLARMVGGTGMVADIRINNFSATTAFIYTDLPVSGKTYVFLLDTLGV